MKMKVSTRIILSIYLLAVIALCLFILAIIFGLLPAEILTQITTTIIDGSIWYRAIHVVIFGAMLVIGICLMFFGIKKEQPKTAVIASFEIGKISIAISALEELAGKFVRQTGAVKGVATRVLSLGDQIEINVKISILPDVSIPDITQDLQAGLINYIESYTGIKVKQAKIMVTSIDETIKANKIIGGN